MDKNRIIKYLLIFFLFSCDNNIPKPNIIYILADDLGYGDLGSYGQKLIETPNIDKLAKNGMQFSQHYSGSPVCAPSRYTLMTGKHTGKGTIRGNDEWASRGKVWDYEEMIKDSKLEGQRPMLEDEITIAQVLKKGGYKTAMFGKWGLGAPNTNSTPNKKGFDFFLGYNCQRQAHTYYPYHLYKNEKRMIMGNKIVKPHKQLNKNSDPTQNSSYSDFNLESYSPDIMFDELMSFLDTQKKGEPFFIHWATPIPHLPLQAPKRWVDYYIEKFGEEKPYLGNKGYYPHKTPRAAYAAMVSYLDENIGKLIQKLKDKKMYDNTLIIFTSDNGPTYDIGGADSQFFNSGGIFDSQYGKGKGFVNEGGIRVPMIASWSKKIKKGTKSAHISAFWDVLPTFAEIANVDIPKNLDGISFLPTLIGGKQKKHSFLYWEFPGYKGQQAVRMGKWKAIRKNISSGILKTELYNLEEDIKELQDISSKNPDIVKKIEDIMKKEHTMPIIDKFKQKALGD